MQNNRMTSFCISGCCSCGWLKLGKQLRSTPISTKHGRYRNLQARLDETTAQHEAHWSTATSRETITKAGARKRRSEVKVSDEICNITLCRWLCPVGGVLMERRFLVMSCVVVEAAQPMSNKLTNANHLQILTCSISSAFNRIILNDTNLSSGAE